MSIVTEKICPKCGEIKHSSQFYKNKLRKDGLRCYCIPCEKEDAKYIQEHEPEKVRNRSRKYYYNNVEKSRERGKKRSKKYRQTHLELVRSNFRIWSNENREKYNEIKKISYWRHRDKAIRRNKAWIESNPGKRTEYSRARRAREVNAGGKFTTKEFRELCEKYGHVCLCCKEKKPLTADHVIPLSKGGSNSINNIQPLCRECNTRKFISSTDYRP